MIEPNASASAIIRRWPDAADSIEAAPSSAVGVADAQLLSKMIAPTVTNGKPALEMLWPAPARSPDRATIDGSLLASPHNIDRVFGLIMTAFALLAIAGPLCRVEYWRRMRGTIRHPADDRAPLHRAATAWRARTVAPLDRPEPTPLRAPVSPRDEPFDWSQQFARAWQELAEDRQPSEAGRLSPTRC